MKKLLLQLLVAPLLLLSSACDKEELLVDYFYIQNVIDRYFTPENFLLFTSDSIRYRLYMYPTSKHYLNIKSDSLAFVNMLATYGEYRKKTVVNCCPIIFSVPLKVDSIRLYVGADASRKDVSDSVISCWSSGMQYAISQDYSHEGLDRAYAKTLIRLDSLSGDYSKWITEEIPLYLEPTLKDDLDNLYIAIYLSNGTIVEHRLKDRMRKGIFYGVNLMD